MQTTNKDKGVVLIIDDDRMIVDLVKMAFAGNGYQVMSAQSGTELNEILDNTALLNETTFDLILLDLLLPDTSGEELYHLLRANDHLAKIPIIILSAAAAVQKRIQLLKMGADDYIIKPFNVDDLLMRATVHIKLGKMRQAKNEVDMQLSLLGEIAQASNSSSELHQSLVKMIENIKSIVQAENGDIFLPSHNIQSLTVASIKNLNEKYMLQAQLDGTGLTAYVLETGKPYMVNDAQKDGRFAPQIDQYLNHKTESLICAPLKVGKGFVCILRLFNKRNGNFTAEDLNLVVSTANIMSIVLENNYLNLLLESSGQHTNGNIQG